MGAPSVTAHAPGKDMTDGSLHSFLQSSVWASESLLTQLITTNNWELVQKLIANLALYKCKELLLDSFKSNRPPTLPIAGGCKLSKLFKGHRARNQMIQILPSFVIVTKPVTWELLSLSEMGENFLPEEILGVLSIELLYMWVLWKLQC